MATLIEPTLFPTPDGFVVDFRNGAPAMSTGLANSVNLSWVISDWWGNSISTEFEIFDSTVYQVLERFTVVQDNLLALEDAFRDSFGTLIRGGVLADAEVTVTPRNLYQVDVAITLLRPSGETIDRFYSIIWDSTSSDPTIKEAD
jgi:hypothetical protein